MAELKDFPKDRKKENPVNDPVRFYSIKDEIRILGFDDAPFKPRRRHVEDSGGSGCPRTMVVGAVYRGGEFLDGVLRTEVEIDGTDATEKLADLVSACKFKDIRVLMIDGLGFGGFNLVDIQELFRKTGIPVITVVRAMPDFAAIRKAIEKMDGPNSGYYLQCMEKAGKPEKVEVRPGKYVYIQHCGISLPDARKIVWLSSTRSLIPEPLRVAHLIASGIVLGESRGGA